MKRFDPELKEKYQNSLLGRLTLKILQEISGHDEYEPSIQQIREYVDKIPSTPIYYNFVLYFLNLKGSEHPDITSFDKLELFKLLDYLEMNPMDEPRFFEVEIYLDSQEEENNTLTNLGVLIHCTPLKIGGYTYCFYLLKEEIFPNTIVQYFELNASSKRRKPFIVASGEDGKPIEYTLDNFQQYPSGKLAINLLNYLYINPIGPEYIPLQELSGKSSLFPYLAPPRDEKFYYFLNKLLLKKIPCVKAIVDLSLIEPYDYDFCLNYSQNIIEKIIDNMEQYSKVGMLLYWDSEKNCFIMSDCYTKYLAYKQLKYERVLIVNMGQIPEGIGEIIETGGIELIPGALIGINEAQHLSNKEKGKLLQQKLDEYNEFRHYKKSKADFILNQAFQIEEDREHEFKDISTSRRPVDSIQNTADEYVVAFLNSNGGSIYWGIQDSDHKVVGVKLKHKDRDMIKRTVSTKLSEIVPSVDPTAFQITFHEVYDSTQKIVSDVYVVEIAVPQVSKKKLYYTGSHVAFVKIDGVKKKLSGPALTDWVKRHLMDVKDK